VISFTELLEYKNKTQIKTKKKTLFYAPLFFSSQNRKKKKCSNYASKYGIYQTIIRRILVYDAEVWQIPTREINKILSTEMDVLRRSARKSRMERTKNECNLLTGSV
jgi:hypothetical protein